MKYLFYTISSLIAISIINSGCSKTKVEKPIPENKYESEKIQQIDNKITLKDCSITFNSYVDGVNIKINGEIFWKSQQNKNNKYLSHDCKNTKIVLEKACYPIKDYIVNFNDFKQKENIDLSYSDWEKFAYIRFDYTNGFSSKINISGLSSDISIKKGNIKSKKVTLGTHNYQIHSDFYLPKNDSIQMCKENEIKIIDLGTESFTDKVAVLGKSHKELQHGYGLVSFVTIQDNANVKLQRYIKPEVDINKTTNNVDYYSQSITKNVYIKNFPDDIVIATPNTIKIPAGQYLLTFNNNKKTIKLLPNNNLIVDLDKL